MIENIKSVVVASEQSKLYIDRPLIIPEASHVEIEGGQKLGVCVIDARHKGVGDTLIIAQGFNASVEEFEIQKTAVNAEQTGTRIIMVDTPGFGENSSGLTACQVLDLSLGLYDSSAEAMLKAAIRAGDLQEGEEIGLVGFSQGASMAAAMAKVLNKKHDSLQKLTLTGVHMIEPVGDHAQISPWLSIKMGTENKLNNGYFAENEELLGPDGRPWPVLSIDRRVAGDPEQKANFDLWSRKHLPGLLLGGWALGGGRIRQDLTSALSGSDDTTRLSEGDISSTVARESHMTSRTRQERLLSELGTLQSELGRVGIISVPGGHPFSLSFQRAAREANVQKRLFRY